MKCKLILTFILSFAMISCSNSQPSDSNIMKTIDDGNKIVKALEEYHGANGEYPEVLEELIPLHLSAIPETGLSTGNKFGYSKIPDEVVTEVIYGYRLTFSMSKNLFIGAREGKRYMYQPSHNYPSDEYKTTIKVVDDWAYQEVQRVYQKR